MDHGEDLLEYLRERVGIVEMTHRDLAPNARNTGPPDGVHTLAPSSLRISSGTRVRPIILKRRP
jgi:hypothetical protein